MKRLKRLLACLILLCCAPLALAQPTPLLTPEQLRADLRFIQESIAATHPEPGFSADPAAVRQAYEYIAEQMQVPMSPDQAWRLLAMLNPLYADGHLAITPAGPLAQSQAFLEAGGRFFPYEVSLDAAGGLRIRAQLGGAPSPLQGARITSINSAPASGIVADLLARSHGDTAAFRASLLSLRWPFMYWKMLGATPQYALQFDDGQRLTVAGAATLPAYLAGNDSFAQQFRFELLPGKAALLTLNTFSWRDKGQFTTFTADAFRQVRKTGVQTLLIDVRANGGGNDDMWIDGVLRYIADKPYRWASTYRKKVIKGRDSAREKLGDVIDGEIGSWQQPQLDDPLHFSGNTYLLVGRRTYSSSILLSNVMQDFGFGKVVGAAGQARTRQSGGTQNFVLPNSGLELGVPRLLFQRPSGAATPVLLQPDIVLPDSPYNERELIDAVLNLQT
ncbi:S41 family peptidase [Janthinobacterium sp. HLX7-2]|uniref:S41 family peptidase n=1 Tax=Janthinobacterium sp. HLX7-2 TaxID=1259331 RepID=UPI003F24547A